MLETDADRNALTRVILAAPSRQACITALASMLTGNDPATPQPTPAVFGQALRDFAANRANWGAQHFRGYLLRARPRVDAPAKSNGKATDIVVNATPSNMTFLLRDFTQALEAAQHVA